DILIPGAQASVYIASQSGEYSVQITDNNGCHASSSSININTTEIEVRVSAQEWSLYPNPFHEFIFLKIPENGKGKIYVSIFDLLGQLVESREIEIGSEKVVSLNLSVFGKGIFYIRLKNQALEEMQAIFKQ